MREPEYTPSYIDKIVDIIQIHAHILQEITTYELEPKIELLELDEKLHSAIKERVK